MVIPSLQVEQVGRTGDEVLAFPGSAVKEPKAAIILNSVPDQGRQKNLPEVPIPELFRRDRRDRLQK